MKYKYILFDLDGTLTDSKEGITKSVQYALKKFGIEIKNLDTLEKFVGPPLKDSFIEFYNFNDDKVAEAVKYYRDYFKDTGIFENKVYDGIDDFLKKLKKLGFKLILATSKPQVFAERILKHFDLMKYFYDFAGSNLDGTRGKKSEVIRYALDKHGIKSEDAVMVGDRRYDIIGARENNIYSIGVTYGYGSVEELENEKPDCIVDSVEKLFKKITDK
ncbi:phosphoglycolate phosphatase [Clostridium algifaecis]|uniref:Phosphoglycolate phosphatase n=1 Tax=Clostridium algifaecis TaxID=1472040 RepID=A0ABS4KX47_9CLOT|nr:HAD family hydrolase [Clostridium algifaecis]MBP2034190.1 phosphoglycolate phosphatase [Clostridium algifaecis]